MCNCNNVVINKVNNIHYENTNNSLKYNICTDCENFKILAIFGMNIYSKCKVDGSNINTIVSTNQSCPINKF